jgi:hypothetical protein
MEKRIRDLVTGDLTLDYFIRRSAEGWKLASVEWVREGSADETALASPVFNSATEIPYGLQLAGSGQFLEENPFEAAVLMMILEQIVKEKRISEIANQLNLAGYKTREGAPWSPPAVFNLLPRLVEAGPALLKSATWEERRATGPKPN